MGQSGPKTAEQFNQSIGVGATQEFPSKPAPMPNPKHPKPAMSIIQNWMDALNNDTVKVGERLLTADERELARELLRCVAADIQVADA